MTATDFRDHHAEVVRGHSTWRVICHRCSELAQDYVERCNVYPDRSWPPLALVEHHDPRTPSTPVERAPRKDTTKCV